MSQFQPRLQIPPSNEPDQLQAFWDQMARAYSNAERTGASARPELRTSGQASDPQSQPTPNQTRSEFRWPDLIGAYHIFNSGMEMPGHNDTGDAIRHAETARELSEKLGPWLTDRLGTYREYLESLIGGQPKGETIMDINNNSEGVTAYRQGRPVDTNRLQTAPGPNPRRSNGYPYR